jgi:hypothetical protein
MTIETVSLNNLNRYINKSSASGCNCANYADMIVLLLCLFKDDVLTTRFMRVTSSGGWLWIMNWERSGRKRSWHILNHYSRICLDYWDKERRTLGWSVSGPRLKPGASRIWSIFCGTLTSAYKMSVIGQQLVWRQGDEFSCWVQWNLHRAS